MPLSRLLLAAAFLVLAAAPGCLSTEEARLRADSAPDPRQERLDQLWAATLQVASERAWSVELASREDLLLTTAWAEEDGGAARRRTRVLALATPQGVGINAHVLRQRRVSPPGEEPAAWEDLPASDADRAEEEAVVSRIYALWQEAW